MRARVAIFGIALIAIATAFFVVRPKPTPGPALRDFESYYAAGSTWRYHGDPYGRDVWRVEKDVPGVVAARDELLPFVGPPYGLPLWDAFGRVPFATAAFVWTLAMALALATLAVVSLQSAGGPIDALDVLGVLTFCAGFGPLTSGVALGQVAVVSCAAIVTFPALLRPRLLLGATVAALAAGLQPNLAVVLVARLAGRRSWLALASAAAIALLGSLLALGGVVGFAKYLAVLRDHAGAERFIAIQTTVAAATRALGAPSGVAGAVAAAVALGVVAILVAQWRSGRYAPNARLALACAAWPLALPFAHEHDFTLAFFPAVLVVREARGAAWVAAALATLCVCVDWLGLAQRPNGALETTLLTLAAGLAMAMFARGDLRPWHVVPGLAALAVPVVGFVAARYPLATWPDALPLGFHVPPAVPAAVVWRAEQIRSGIGALEPAWGVLRALSLAGCAGIWFVAARVLATDATTAARRSEASSTPRRRPAEAYPSS